MLEKAREIYANLGAVPSIAMVKMNQGIILCQMGENEKAEEHLSSAVDIFENLGAMPDLCESYVALARFKLKANLSVEARFHISQADALVHRINYDPMKIQVWNAWGEFYQGEGLYSDSIRSFQSALAISRKLCNTYEEARALRNLGDLALLSKDYRECEAKLKQSLEIFNRLEAMYDVMSIYCSLANLALAKEEYVKAEEISILLERQGKLLGYADLNIKALIILAECEMHTGRKDKAREDCSEALKLSEGRGDSAYSKTLNLLMEKILKGLLDDRDEKQDESKDDLQGVKSDRWTT